jgi:hypothetical protein
MGYEKLDLYFPYFMFTYGVFMTLVLQSERLMKWAQAHFPAELVERLNGAKVLGALSLWLGGLWILQNLWFA